MKAIVTGMVVVAGALCLGSGYQGRSMRTYQVTFTNITHGVILTPPMFALSQKKIDLFEVGEAAGLGLEMLAEGGATDELQAELETVGVQDVVQTDMPVLPGQSITVTLDGNRFSRLNLASMLLPTNDGFVAMNGARVGNHTGHNTFYLRAHDAGTEINDELCASIPGPQCGGDGFNEEGGEGFVTPHPGIHGEAELGRMAYDWSDPVARVTVHVAGE